MGNRPVQYFSEAYLEHCKTLTPEQIVDFLEQFREIAALGKGRSKSKLISIKVPENLLGAFKTRARIHGEPYQSIIKSLMREWLVGATGFEPATPRPPV